MNTLQNNYKITFKTVDPFKDTEVAKTIWIALLSKCPHSYFISWGWISTWLNSLPNNCKVRLVTGYFKNEPVLAFFTGYAKRNKYGFIPTKLLSLNSTGEPYFDQLTIEHNSILVDKLIPINITEVLENFLLLVAWDEFFIPGASANFVSDFNLSNNDISYKYCSIIERITNSYFVDLQKVREMKMNYLQLLSANKRSQIRRSIKQYETQGSICVREAENLQEALKMFDQLSRLHQQEWKKRGEPGSFSNNFFVQFHKNLIRDRFHHNEIQILHIYNKESTIGYLYNFTYDNDVLFYQCGFNYSTQNNYRPGIVSHYFAVLHNAEKNMNTYDFLAGNSAYKNSLSTNSTPMYWIRLFKNPIRHRAEKKLMGIKKKINTYIRPFVKLKARFLPHSYSHT